MPTYIISQATLDAIRALIATLLAMLAGLGVVVVPPPPPPSVATFLMLAVHPEQYPNYKALNGPRSHVAMLTNNFDKNDPVIVGLDAAHTPYYFMAAYSSYPQISVGHTEYVPIADVQDVLNRTANEGIVFFEMVTWIASVNNWQCDVAVGALDWNWVDQVVLAAQQHGKRVVWSEPVCWGALASSSVAQAHFAKWGNTVVPMFATNFDSSGSANLDAAIAGSTQIATRYGLPVGESHQSWYFQTKGITVTAANSQALAQLGQSHGATYYEVEGDGDYMLWGSPYLQGIANFAGGL